MVMKMNIQQTLIDAYFGKGTSVRRFKYFFCINRFQFFKISARKKGGEFSFTWFYPKLISSKIGVEQQSLLQQKCVNKIPSLTAEEQSNNFLVEEEYHPWDNNEQDYEQQYDEL